MKKTHKVILAIALVTLLFSPVVFISLKAFADENNIAASAEKAEDTADQEATEAATTENTEVAVPEENEEAEKPEQTKQGYVLVSYIDENGSAIVPSQGHMEDIGKPYTFKAKVIPGYELSTTDPANTAERSGVFANENKKETFVYKKLDSYQGVHVTFDLNGGTGSVSSLDVAAGEDLIFPSSEDLTKTGYRFVGWNAKADGSDTMYDAGYVLTLPSSTTNSYVAGETPTVQNLTYYAIWREVSDSDLDDPEEHNYVGYSISFDANTGVGSVPASFNKKFGEKFVMPSADSLSKSGYHFVAWNDEMDGSGKSYPAGANINVVSPGSYSSATPASYAVKTAYVLPEEYVPVILYAQWAPGEAPVAAQPNKQITMGQPNVAAQNKQQLPATGENNQSYFLVVGLVTVIVSAGVFAVQYKLKKHSAF